MGTDKQAKKQGKTGKSSRKGGPREGKDGSDPFADPRFSGAKSDIVRTVFPPQRIPAHVSLCD